MTKISTVWVATIVAGALVTQGCAQTGSVRSADISRQVPPAVAESSQAAAVQRAIAIPERDGKPVIAVDTKANFENVVAAIRREMQPGGRFTLLKDPDRQTLDTGFASMQALFDQYGSVDKMSAPAQATLRANQSAIDEILARVDGNRLICWKETPVGTHFPKTVCQKLAQLQHRDEQSQRVQDAIQRVQQQGRGMAMPDPKIP